MNTPPGIGRRVRVKPGVIDLDTGQSLAGWEADILAEENGSYLLAWTKETLRDLPAAYREDSLLKELDFTRYYLPAADFEVLSRPRNLLDILAEVRGNGVFFSRGEVPALPLGLTVRDYGEVALPLKKKEAKQLVAIARQAPFGRGAETVLDTTVRNAYEIDAEAISFANPAWQSTLREITKRVAADLDVAGKVVAEPYKLLVYEKGGFFLPHQDSEKAPGMFATLIIGLPSRHEGGLLRVSFDGKEEVGDFSAHDQGFTFPYAAFFADCEHELTEVTAGYRVCLVYNLCRTKAGKRPQPLATSGIVEELAAAIAALPPAEEVAAPRTVLLDHQYTPANFGYAALKGADRARADVLLAAAEMAGHGATLGLVTLHQVGELEDDDYSYRNYRRSYWDDDYDDDDNTEGTMGEVHEQHTDLALYDVTGQNVLGQYSVEEAELITTTTIGEGEPTEQEKEGFTGNAGMTMQYWYHYGAVAFWPRAATESLLLDQPAILAVNWLPIYLEAWEDEQLDSPEMARRLLARLAASDAPLIVWGKPAVNFGAIADALLKLNEPSVFRRYGAGLLAQGAPWIEVAKWRQLLEVYGETYLVALLSEAFERVPPAHLAALLTNVRGLVAGARDSLLPAIWPALCAAVQRSRPTNLSNVDELGLYYLPALTVFGHLSDHAGLSDTEKNLAREAMTADLTRDYVHQVLPAVAALWGTHYLAKACRKAALTWLRAAVAAEPVAPSDWSKPVPKINHSIQKELAAFMRDPQRIRLDFKAVKEERSNLERLLKYGDYDLAFETIRQGSPHTLRLVKTHESYDRALREWVADGALLREMER